ncbi:hypothetical protein GE09DRAFT_128884 [Coniochaeta sp. 2T2.1]|nr:hypothetical protein GE09DRAFT_128884 [Coniochaeta sp. 2T2.1]
MSALGQTLWRGLPQLSPDPYRRPSTSRGARRLVPFSVTCGWDPGSTVYQPRSSVKLTARGCHVSTLPRPAQYLPISMFGNKSSCRQRVPFASVLQNKHHHLPLRGVAQRGSWHNSCCPAHIQKTYYLIRPLPRARTLYTLFPCPYMRPSWIGSTRLVQTSRHVFPACLYCPRRSEMLICAFVPADRRYTRRVGDDIMFAHDPINMGSVIYHSPFSPEIRSLAWILTKVLRQSACRAGKTTPDVQDANGEVLHTILV